MSRKESEEKENKIKNEEKDKHEKKKGEFKKGFPSKVVVEARIAAAINGASNLPQLKTAIEKILNGDKDTPGLVDALFHLDR